MPSQVTALIQESLDYIRTITSLTPKIGIVLGSGLGHFAEKIKDAHTIAAGAIPNYPVSTVPGHAGKLVLGRLNSADIVAQQGRVHSYEGYPMEQVTYPIRLMAALGIQTLIVTNAAGGVNSSFHPGDLMIITDHINFSFRNPLVGMPVDDEKNRTVDMFQAYDPEYIALAEATARELNISIRKGVLCMTHGPNYETAAEVRAIRVIGGDACTMSTVPEVIVARQLGLRVLGISCITNMATGVGDSKLDHHEVTVIADQIAETFERLISTIIKRMV